MIRQAQKNDIDFIVHGIIEAEKSGTPTLAYSTLFQLNEKEVADLIKQVLEEEIQGQEWDLSAFFVYEENQIPIACLSAWCEGQEGVASGILKAQALAYFLGNKWREAAQLLQLVAQTQIDRLPAYVQLECIFTAEGHRGKGIAKKLIEAVVAEATLKFPNHKGFEIQLMGNNASALRSYTKCGFVLREEKTAPDPTILSLLPDKTRISLVKEQG